MIQRSLTFASTADVLDGLERLHTSGYQQIGQWNLGQVCEHLAYFIEGSMDGYTFGVPWLLKVLLGRMVLRRILSQGRMKPGVPTPQKPLPAAGVDQSAAVDRLRRAIGRLDVHQGEFHDSPFFGHLTPAQWRQLHLIHCAHHFGFLQPKDAQ